VFTDVDCGYCRQLHRDIDTLTALGIEVRYLSYPRTGPNTESWTKAEHVWCAKDRGTALTEAKRGADVPSTPGCTATPVAAQYELGRSVGVSGTPAIFAETGEELGGYLPPAALFERLEQLVEAH
jgi:thiol:disulfide interchange protein DsbC